MKRVSNLKKKYSKRKYNSKKIRGGTKKGKGPNKNKNDRRGTQGEARSQFNEDELQGKDENVLRNIIHNLYASGKQFDNFPQKNKDEIKKYTKDDYIKNILMLQKKLKENRSTSTATTTTSQPATQTTSKGYKSNSSGASSSEGKTQGKTIAPRLKWIIQNMPILYNGLDINCKYDKSLYTNVEEIERKMRSMHSTIQKGILSEECRELSRQRGSRESRSRGRYNISNNSNSL